MTAEGRLIRSGMTAGGRLIRSGMTARASPDRQVQFVTHGLKLKLAGQLAHVGDKLGVIGLRRFQCVKLVQDATVIAQIDHFKQ